MLPFDSKEAAKLNLEIFKHIKSEAIYASEQMGILRGRVMGTRRRNTTVMAVAPTKSSSFVLGQVSQGIEPIMSNYFVNNTAKGVFVYKNPYLEELLKEQSFDTEEVWESIRKAGGSVQHLLFLTEEEKNVFKTFVELDQSVLIDQAGIRQQYIDQGQSLNIIIDPKMSMKEVNQLYIKAWKMGVKSLYYQFNMSAAQEFTKNKECVACHA
jgi:ribonucleoside-diphosphate reductase alpha chain